MLITCQCSVNNWPCYCKCG